jgi:hypothetical protein
MHGINNIKFISAQQKRGIYQYENSKERLCKTNASVWFNKMCRQLQLTPEKGVLNVLI